MTAFAMSSYFHMINLKLKPYSGVYRDFIRRLFLDERTSVDFIHNNTFTSLNSFDHWFEDRLEYSFRDFFIIENAGEPAGVVYSYGYDEVAQHVKLTIALLPEFCGVGLGALVIIPYLDKLFVENGLHKVFAEIYSFNEESLLSTRKFGFVEEGVLHDYKLVDGAYYDLHILSMTRKRFYEIKEDGKYEKLFGLCGSLFE